MHDYSFLHNNHFLLKNINRHHHQMYYVNKIIININSANNK